MRTYIAWMYFRKRWYKECVFEGNLIILNGAVGTIWSQLPWPSLCYTVKGLFLGVVALEQFLLSLGQLYVEAGNGSKSGTSAGTTLVEKDQQCLAEL